MKDLYLPRITADYHDETKIRVETSGCGCCTDTVAGMELDDDLNRVYKMDKDKLQSMLRDCREAITVIEGLLAADSKT